MDDGFRSSPVVFAGPCMLRACGQYRLKWCPPALLDSVAWPVIPTWNLTPPCTAHSAVELSLNGAWISFVAACSGPSSSSAMPMPTWFPCAPSCRLRKAPPCWMVCWTRLNPTKSRSCTRAFATYSDASTDMLGINWRPWLPGLQREASQDAEDGRLAVLVQPANARLHVPTLLRNPRFVWNRWRSTRRKLRWKWRAPPLQSLAGQCLTQAGTCADPNFGGHTSDEADPVLPYRVGLQCAPIQMHTSGQSHSWSSPGPKSRASSRQCDFGFCTVLSFGGLLSYNVLQRCTLLEMRGLPCLRCTWREVTALSRWTIIHRNKALRDFLVLYLLNPLPTPQQSSALLAEHA